MSHFSERFRIARDAAGATQSDIARAIGVTKASVSGWETGFSKSIKMTHLFPVARFLRCDPEWLATGRPPVGGGGVGEAFDLAPEEARWLRLMRALPEVKRRKLIKTLMALLEQIADAKIDRSAG